MTSFFKDLEEDKLKGFLPFWRRGLFDEWLGISLTWETRYISFEALIYSCTMSLRWQHMTAPCHMTVPLYWQVATFILQKILLDETGLSYICQTYDRFSHVAMILVSVHLYITALIHYICYLLPADIHRLQIIPISCQTYRYNTTAQFFRLLTRG